MDNNVIAHPNIALLKYWGKNRTENDYTPTTSSISLRLDFLFTETVISKNELPKHQFFINGKEQPIEEVEKLLNIIGKRISHLDHYLLIDSKSNIPFKAGISSSSSGMAAFINAVNHYFGLNLSLKEKIDYARSASGSACRSFYSLCFWDTNNNVQEISTDLQLKFLVLVVSEAEKTIPSRKGMQMAQETSTSYKQFTDHSEVNFPLMLEAFKNNDFSTIGKIMEENTLLMHETTKNANPSFSYLNNQSLEAMQVVHKLRNQGLEVYFTFDAGPNLKILYQSKDHHRLLESLKELWQGKIISE